MVKQKQQKGHKGNKKAPLKQEEIFKVRLLNN